MLTTGIFATYHAGVKRLAEHPGVETLARRQASNDANLGQLALFATDLNNLLADEMLGAEVFGAAALLVRCSDIAGMRALVKRPKRQLTVTLHMAHAEPDVARTLLPVLERKVGRALVNGWPTGVAVCHAVVHGGPFPAMSDGRSTLFSMLAIRRFLRPVGYQDFPSDPLPDMLRKTKSWGVPRVVEGRYDGPDGARGAHN